MVTGCQSPVLVGDISPKAITSNDKTLAMNACSTSIDRGVQVCRVKQDSQIETLLHLLIPWFKDSIGAEIIIRHQDRVKTYQVEGSQFTVNWSDFFESGYWQGPHDGLVQILTTTTGESYTTRALGYVYFIVLGEGYNPAPVLSKEKRGEMCKIFYTTGGRSSMYCFDE